MSLVQNREMTLRCMRKLVNLNGFLKQISYADVDKSSLLFKEDWVVDILK